MKTAMTKGNVITNTALHICVIEYIQNPSILLQITRMPQ